MKRIDTHAGALEVIELPCTVPFAVHRIYWLRDTPAHATRGLHAHRTLRQVLVLLSGSVRVELDDGHTTSVHKLHVDNPQLTIEPITWRVLSEFEEDTVIMVLASAPYDPDDYIHDYATFLTAARAS